MLNFVYVSVFYLYALSKSIFSAVMWIAAGGASF